MKSGRVLVTGASGFVGRFMCSHLLARRYAVVGLQRKLGLDMPEGVETIIADLRDAASLLAIPRRWDAVVHLAGESIPSSFATTAPVLANVDMTLALLEHLQDSRVLLVSSCHVYAPSNVRRVEEAPIAPQGRYGLSKHLVEQLASHYARKLDIRVARPFNHLGPGQRPELVIPSLIRRLIQAKHDGRPVVMNGIDSVRDFISVQDVVAGYLAIIEAESPRDHVFNVCTGQGENISTLVREVLRLLGSSRPVTFLGHPNSSDDLPYLVGDPSRLRAVTGWEPKTSLTGSLAAMIRASQGFASAESSHSNTEPR